MASTYTLSWAWSMTITINGVQVSSGSGGSTTIKPGDVITIVNTDTNGGGISTSWLDIDGIRCTPKASDNNGTFEIPAQGLDIYWSSSTDGLDNLSITLLSENYIIFTGESGDFTLAATNRDWDGTVEYSTDKVFWEEWDGTAISSENQIICLRGIKNTCFYANNGADGVKFILSERASCSGNLNTLLDYKNPPTELPDYCFEYLFYGCSNLTLAPELPATTLGRECYTYMFSGCTSLTTPPELPATTLAEDCYSYMFDGCTNLTITPELQATTLASACYMCMFKDCTNLTTAPKLPATVLDNWCYSSMFSGCINLKMIPTIAATTLAPHCCEEMFCNCKYLKISSIQNKKYSIPWSITSETSDVSWSLNMFSGTGGSFTGDPEVNITYYQVAQDELAGTWVFNEDVFGKNIHNNITFNVTFVSNGQTFNSVIFNNNPMNGGMFYDTLQVVHPDDASHFIDQSYRTITITSKLSEVTNGNTLLALLQANATKQTLPTIDIREFSAWNKAIEYISSLTTLSNPYNYKIKIYSNSSSYNSSEPAIVPINLVKTSDFVKSTLELCSDYNTPKMLVKGEEYTFYFQANDGFLFHSDRMNASVSGGTITKDWSYTNGDTDKSKVEVTIKINEDSKELLISLSADSSESSGGGAN